MILSNIVGKFARFSKLVSGSMTIQGDSLTAKILRFLSSAYQIPTILGVQVDATLDPGLTPTVGDSYILTDTAALHANFGTITGVGDDDIVVYEAGGFVVAFDASGASANDRIKTYNTTTEEDWIYTGIWAAQSGGGLDTSTPTTWTSGAYDVTVGTSQLGTSPVYTFTTSDLPATGKKIDGYFDPALVGGAIISVNGVTVSSAETNPVYMRGGIYYEPVGAGSPTAIMEYIYYADPVTGDGFWQIGTALFVEKNGTTGDELVKISANAISDYANDTAAGVGGLSTGHIYYTTATAATADIAIGDRILKIKA